MSSQPNSFQKQSGQPKPQTTSKPTEPVKGRNFIKVPSAPRPGEMIGKDGKSKDVY